MVLAAIVPVTASNIRTFHPNFWSRELRPEQYRQLPEVLEARFTKCHQYFAGFVKVVVSGTLVCLRVF